MGWTTSVMVIMLHGEDENDRFAEINFWLQHKHPFGDYSVGRLEWVHEHDGGTRASNMLVAMGSFRNLPSPRRLVKFLAEDVRWKIREEVLVVINDEDDDRPTAIYLDDEAEANAKKAWPKNDWDWWHTDDGGWREHTPEEWARYHYGNDWKGHVDSFRCPDGALPDGPVCPKCGKPRAPSGIGGGTWVHTGR